MFLAAKLNSEPCMRVLLAAGALPEITQEMLDEARQRSAPHRRPPPNPFAEASFFKGRRIAQDPSHAHCCASRGAALLQKSCNYELQRHATLELKAVQQPLAAAVEAILSNQQDAARIVKLLRPLERAEEQALLGGQNSPLEVSNPLLVNHPTPLPYPPPPCFGFSPLRCANFWR